MGGIAGKQVLTPSPFTRASLAQGALFNLSTNPVFWVDAARIQGLDDGDSHTDWKDLSGADASPTQATGSKQPIYKASQLNGLPISRGDGVDDILVHSISDFRGSDTSGTIFFVVKRNDSTENHFFASSDEGSNSHFIDFQTDVSGLFRITARISGSTNSVKSTTASSTSAFNIFMARSNGTTWTMRIDGADDTVQVQDGSNTGDWFGDVLNRDNVTIFAGKRNGSEVDHANLDLAEIIQFPSALGSSDVDIVENYLSEKWSIAI